LTFCTPGILLRSFSDPSFLKQVTHLILDEVHERDKFSDFVLGYLKQERRNLEHLRVIVMSADVDVNVFGDFFGTCPLIDVEGIMFPVQVMYLNEVLRIVNFKVQPVEKKTKKRETTTKLPVRRNSKIYEEVHELLLEVITDGDEFAASKLVKFVNTGKLPVDFLDPELNVTPLGACASRFMVEHVQELLKLGADLNKESGGWKTSDLVNLLDSSLVELFDANLPEESTLDNEDILVADYIKTIDLEKVDTLLVSKLIKHIHTTNFDTNGILVFLPGFEDIVTLKYLLCNNDFIGGRTFQLFLLHSTIEADQRNVFKKMPPGVRKIILSTNIAETSLTVKIKR
jgi:HrpA-like RNA helicase